MPSRDATSFEVKSWGDAIALHLRSAQLTVADECAEVRRRTDCVPAGYRFLRLGPEFCSTVTFDGPLGGVDLSTVTLQNLRMATEPEPAQIALLDLVEEIHLLLLDIRLLKPTTADDAAFIIARWRAALAKQLLSDALAKSSPIASIMKALDMSLLLGQSAFIWILSDHAEDPSWKLKPASLSSVAVDWNRVLDDARPIVAMLLIECAQVVSDSATVQRGPYRREASTAGNTPLTCNEAKILKLIIAATRDKQTLTIGQVRDLSEKEGGLKSRSQVYVVIDKLRTRGFVELHESGMGYLAVGE